MTTAERELIEEKFSGVHAMMQANNDINHMQHTALMESVEKVLQQALKTNGRVTSIEKETRFFRFVERNPKISIGLGMLIMVGFIAVGTWIGWETLLSKFI